MQFLDAQSLCNRRAICYFPVDLSCETGIRALVASNICCLKSCGKCGDTGCGLRPGGAVGCCVQSIENSKRSCAEYPPPCIVPVISISSTTTTSKGTTLTSTTGTATTTFGKIADSISSKIITPTTVTMPPRSTSATTITTTTSASTDYDSDHRSTIATTTTSCMLRSTKFYFLCPISHCFTSTIATSPTAS